VGLRPILFTLPSNTAGIEPNARSAEMPEVRAILDAGAELEAKGMMQAAAAHYRAAYEAAVSQRKPSAPLLLYRAARCEEMLGQYDAARRDYWLVVDSDSRQNFGRATTVQNGLIRSLGVEYRIPVVDGVAAFERAAPHGILGNELFADGHHPNLEGYRLLAEECVARLAEVLPAERTEGLADVDGIIAALGISAANMRSAHLMAGSWLLSASAYHPWPRDRMDLAEAHFRAALASNDDVSALLGIALSQGARDGKLLSEDEVVDELGRAHQFYTEFLSVSPGLWEKLLPRLRDRGVEEQILARLDLLLTGRGSAPL
jgi:tetratricopeptide (TPR) repeat protein